MLKYHLRNKKKQEEAGKDATFITQNDMFRDNACVRFDYSNETLFEQSYPRWCTKRIS